MKLTYIIYIQKQFVHFIQWLDNKHRTMRKVLILRFNNITFRNERRHWFQVSEFAVCCSRTSIDYTGRRTVTIETKHSNCNHAKVYWQVYAFFLAPPRNTIRNLFHQYVPPRPVNSWYIRTGIVEAESFLLIGFHFHFIMKSGSTFLQLSWKSRARTVRSALNIILKCRPRNAEAGW